MIINISMLFKGLGLLRRTNMMEPCWLTSVGRGWSNSAFRHRATPWVRTSTEILFYDAVWTIRHVNCVCGATHDRSWVTSYIVLSELIELQTRDQLLFHISILFQFRVFIEHATACAVQCNWSAWKYLCKVERATMTNDYLEQRIIISGYCSGRYVVLSRDLLLAVRGDCSKTLTPSWKRDVYEGMRNVSAKINMNVFSQLRFFDVFHP